MNTFALKFLTSFSNGAYIDFNMIKAPDLKGGSFFAYLRSNSTFQLVSESLATYGYTPLTNTHLNLMRAGSVGVVLLYDSAIPEVKKKVLPIHKMIVIAQRIAIALSILSLARKKDWISHAGTISGIGTQILICQTKGKTQGGISAFAGLLFRLPFLMHPQISRFVKGMIIFQWSISYSSLLPIDFSSYIYILSPRIEEKKWEAKELEKLPLERFILHPDEEKKIPLIWRISTKVTEWLVQWMEGKDYDQQGFDEGLEISRKTLYMTKAEKLKSPAELIHQKMDKLKTDDLGEARLSLITERKIAVLAIN